MDLSIIVPAYNVEKYIKKCLESVSDLKNILYEIIVINDGSTDSTGKAIAEFCKGFNGNIKVVNQRNAGLSCARNTGLSWVKGDYICFLDSDDYVYGDRLVDLVIQVIEDSVDIGFADCVKNVNGKIKKQDTLKYRKKAIQKDNCVCSGIEYAEKVFNKVTNYISSEACFCIYSNEFIKNNSLRFKEGIYHEDTLFFFQNVTIAKKVKYYNIEFYVYAIREGSTMTDNTISIKRAYDKFVIAGELIKLKKNNDIFAYYLDSTIVNLYFYTIVRLRIIKDYDIDNLKICKKLSLKSRVMYYLMKLRK